MNALSGPAELPASEDLFRIVVGIDGSEPSAKALQWAIEYARRRPTVIDIVTAWTFPMVEGYAFTTTVGEVEKNAHALLNGAMSHVTEEDPEIVVRGETADGEAGPVLVNAAKGADFLVIGARGISGIERLLQGSVSAYCAKHATCTVVVVR